MLTIFSIPKPFEGHIGVIQRNAIKSWTLLTPEIQVILVGSESGTLEAAVEFGCQHIPDVPRNRFGTPLVSGVFEAAELMAKEGKLAYVNADIILMQDFITAIRALPQTKSLMGGIRWNADITDQIDFTDPEWETFVREFALAHGKAHGLTGIDYFVYDKGLFSPIPSFASGRFYWDMWLLYQARINGATIIDASHDVFAIHQNHTYHHAAKMGDCRSVITGEEAFENRLLVKGPLLHLGDANARMVDGKIKPYFRRNAAHVANEVALFIEEHLNIFPLPQLSTWAARQFWDRNWKAQFSAVLKSRGL